MRYIALESGKYRVLEDVNLADLKSQPQFFWLDVDRIDPATEAALKRRYGIELEPLSYPHITTHPDYDLLVLNYYQNLEKRNLQLFVSDNHIITVHSGSDPLCDELVALLDEVLVSSSFNTEGLLYRVLSIAIDHNSDHLKSLQSSMADLEAELKSGVREDEILRIVQLRRDVEEAATVFSELRQHLSGLQAGSVTLHGVKAGSNLLDLYLASSLLVSGISEIQVIIEHYLDAFLVYYSRRISSIRRIVLPLSTLSVFAAFSSLLYLYLPQLSTGIDPWLPSLLLLLVGSIVAVLTSRSSPFSLS